MKIQWSRQYTTVAVYAFLVIAASILLCISLVNFALITRWVLWIVMPLRPVAYGFVLAYVLNPVLCFFEQRLLPRLLGKKAALSPKGLRGLSVLCTMLLVLILLVAFFGVIIPDIVASVASIANQAKTFAANVEPRANELFSWLSAEGVPQELLEGLRHMAGQFFDSLYSGLTSTLPVLINSTILVAGNMASGLVRMVVGLIISIYLLLDKERFICQIRKVLHAVCSERFYNRLTEVVRQSHRIFSGFISGKILDSAIIGLLCFVGTSLLGMPNAMLISLIVGVTNVIPYFGPFFGAIPSAMIVLIDSPVKALTFLVFIFILQQLDGNVIGPAILGDSTGIPPFWVVVAVLFFGNLLNVVGMFIGVPTFAVIYWLAGQAINARLAGKELPTQAEAYLLPGEQLPAGKKGRKKKLSLFKGQKGR